MLNDLKPSVFFSEETKYKDAGRLKLDGYLIFEKVRKSKVNGGGLAIGCVRELNPVWVREGEDEVRNMKTNFCVG